MEFFNKLSLKTKVMIAVGIACSICFVVSITVAIHYNEKEFQEGLVEKSRTIHSRLDSATRYVATQGGLKPMIERYTKLYKNPADLKEEDKIEVLKQVPIYAAMKIGADESEKEHYKFRVFSNEPRNKDNMANAEEMKVFKQFEDNPSLPEIVENNGKVVTVYRPVRLKESHGCFACHGDPATSPWGNGSDKDILGYKMENWKEGKLHGVFAVSNDVALVHKAQSEAGGTSSTTYLAIFIAIGAFFALLMSAFIIKGPIQAIRAAVAKMNESSDQVNSTSATIASSAATLSQATTEQASSLEETAASLEQITAMIAKASDGANTTASSSLESQKKAEDGSSAVGQMMESMSEISKSNEAIMDQITKSNQQMGEIVTVIQNIGQKTKVINDIVFQTKLLSFNASVEAARAGEHGKGFAVVAEEVGNLAQMSGNAAKEITEMLESSVSKVEGIVNETKSSVSLLIEQGKQKVESGVGTAKRCAGVLDEIVKNVSTVAELAKEISNASKEQAQGVGEINKAMSQLDTVTQQNASISESTASSADALSNQAKALKSVVVELASTIEGYGNEPKANAPSMAVPANIYPMKKPVVNKVKPKKALKVASGDGVIPSSDHDGFQDE